MRTADLSTRIKVGQYWFDTSSLTLHKVSEVQEDRVYFDEGRTVYLTPIQGFVYLWYTMILHLASFQGSVSPALGQVWVSNSSQDLFIIHPDQGGIDPCGVRVLSDSSQIEGAAFLFHEPELPSPPEAPQEG